MSATNSTTHYGLSQYIGSDEPKYLVDYNGDMDKIDAGIYEAKSAADTAQTGVNNNATAINSLDGAVSALQTSVETLGQATSGNTGSINTINELLGSGEPTTQNKTIIGAINELAGEIGEGSADDITYDNTGSGLSATNVQGAIDEIVSGQGGGISASAVAYDNTTSGLTATDVQDAVDEVNAKIPTGGLVDLNLVTSGTGTVTMETGMTLASVISSVKYLFNADASIGKIYGGIKADGSLAIGTNWTKIASISITDLPTINAPYYIEMGYNDAVYDYGGSSGLRGAFLTRMKFNTNKTIDIEMLTGTSVTLKNCWIDLVPCIYILKDLGD